jgi:hypothetical protein
MSKELKLEVGSIIRYFIDDTPVGLAAEVLIP